MNGDENLARKESRLIESLASLSAVVVAYSGGVDSSLLAFYARKVLGAAAHIVIAVSPSLAMGELAAARKQASELAFDLIEISTDEVEDEAYRRNDPGRCFFCKSTLFQVLEKIRLDLGGAAIVYGANMNDLDDVRPGHQAAKQYGVRAPLIEAELYKEEIRALARAAGLSSWDRPQAACLSSRFPTYTYISPQRLSQVDKMEDIVRSFGFRQVRVRYMAQRVSVEVGAAELERFDLDKTLAGRLSEALVSAVDNGVELADVFIDPEGYVQGKAARIAAITD